MEEYIIEINISDEDRAMGKGIAQKVIISLTEKLRAGEITHPQFAGFLWEMRDLCDDAIDAIAETQEGENLINRRN